jgi:hypothetical protein
MADTTHQLARGLAVSRVVFGAAIIAAPRLSASVWIGPRRASRPEAMVLGRALGARDLVLGVAAAKALWGPDPQQARAALVACAVCDGTDLLATVAARGRLPGGPAAFSGLAAATSTAISLAALAATTGTAQRPPATPAEQDAETFREEIANDPSVNPPAELDRLRGG